MPGGNRGHAAYFAVTRNGGVKRALRSTDDAGTQDPIAGPNGAHGSERWRCEFAGPDQAGAVVAIDWTPDQTKAELKHTIAVAAGTDSHAILQRLWEGRHVGCAYLFHAEPCGARAPEATPCVGDLRAAWKAACKVAGLPAGRSRGGYVFKDLRNSFVSDMVDAGEDAAVIASFTGWKNLAMLQRYTTVAKQTQRDVITRKNALRAALPARIAAHTGRRIRCVARNLRDSRCLQAVCGTCVPGRPWPVNPTAKRPRKPRPYQSGRARAHTRDADARKPCHARDDAPPSAAG